ncbi:hypothetical protein Tco_1238949 [Tanacetum coccineum]
MLSTMNLIHMSILTDLKEYIEMVMEIIRLLVSFTVDDDGVEMMMWCAAGGDDDDDGIVLEMMVLHVGVVVLGGDDVVATVEESGVEWWLVWWGGRNGGDAMIGGGVYRLWQPKVSPEMGDGGRKTWPEKGEAPETYERGVCV